MRKVILITALYFPLLSFAQTGIINPGLVYPDSPYVYIGVPNTLKITGSSKNGRLTLDNGSVSRATDKNEYTATFSSQGIANVIVWQNGKAVCRKKYFIKHINDPVLLFAGKADSMLSVKEILASPCLSISIPGCYINHKFTIVSFETYFIYQQGDTPTVGMSNNWCMHEGQIASVKKLQPGDKILITDIRVNGPDSMIRTLADKLITIKP
jgi:GldM C-terminal domain